MATRPCLGQSRADNLLTVRYLEVYLVLDSLADVPDRIHLKSNKQPRLQYAPPATTMLAPAALIFTNVSVH